MSLDPTYVVAGALTGFIVGVTGVGGGALMTPILLLVFGVSPAVAIGTDLWFASITKLAITGVHAGKGIIDWPIAARLWAGSITGAVATLWWLHDRPMAEGPSHFLVAVVTVAVCLTAIGMLAQPSMQIASARRQLHGAIALQVPLTVVAGAILGVLVTLTSVGAGALGAVMLAFLYPSRLTPVRLVATDIVHAIPLAMIAGLGHLMDGRVNGGLLVNLLAGSIPAGLLGAMLSVRLSRSGLRIALALILLLIGVKMGAGLLATK